MELDLQLEKYTISSGGFAPDPWVLDVRIVHRPGESETYPVQIPTKTGEVIDWSSASRSKKWIAVSDVEKAWILKATARPVKPEARADKFNQAIKTAADVTGQMTDLSLPLSSWLISDIINVGSDLLNLGEYLQQPFAVGETVLEGPPDSPVTIPMEAPTPIEPPGPKTREAWEDNEFTNMNTGETFTPAEEQGRIEQGDDQGYVEVSVEEW